MRPAFTSTIAHYTKILPNTVTNTERHNNLTGGGKLDLVDGMTA